jgi:hypothetical protein
MENANSGWQKTLTTSRPPNPITIIFPSVHTKIASVDLNVTESLQPRERQEKDDGNKDV